MTDIQQRAAAKAFAENWKEKGYEKGESQPFWLSLLRDVYGVDHPEQFILFEEQVHLDHTSFIDGFIPETKVLIEQKGLGKDLNKPIKQSDGTLLTPFQQAKRYISELPKSKHPDWVVTSNFSEFWVYDMEKPQGEPEKIRLEDLEKEYYRLSFLTDKENVHLRREMEISIQAGDIVGLLYDALLKQYVDPNNEETLKSLNKLCVRLVFCLYAEDAGIFGKREMFHDYLAKYDTEDLREALDKLFRVLDTPVDKRSPYLKQSLAQFPFVNGGLFADEEIEIPQLTDEIRDLLLVRASENFDWSEISPTIFGAVFESTLNPQTRRAGGMHYTSIENIHKVIDPLFLDDLKQEFEEIKAISVVKMKEKRLKEFQTKLASLSFLDPAAGSGNFLTETYLSLRRLENEVIALLMRGQIVLGDAANSPIQVSISQFYGIEINDFAVTVAKTALWIAESQMMKETETIVLMPLEFLPLKTNANIVEANALRINWNDVVPKEKLSFIMGNPPFVGYAYQSKEQKSDLAVVCPECGKSIDYVAGWYYKAAQLMQETHIHAALVSTNSITQGEQVSAVWKPLMEKYRVSIDFARRTFRWDSEANMKAHVHCVIIGFSCEDMHNMSSRIFENGRAIKVGNISPYLVDSPTVFIDRRTAPICDVPPFTRGCQPTDDGNFILSEEEKNYLIKEEPEAEQFIRPFMMGKDFIQRKPRFCIWLQGANPSILKKCPKILERVERVRLFRLKSTKAATIAKAETPTLFDEIREPQSTYIGFPTVSSERRKYVPIDYLEKEVIPGNKIYFMQDASLFHFGVVTSNVHMAWMRATCGRLKSDYNYSNTIVYNNFPWPSPTDAQRARIEQTAQAILDARALYPDASLADLYDELTMPPELRKAHQENDKAVMQAYSMSIKDTTESSCVAELMRLYQEKVSELGKKGAAK